ncbi:MAG TPA: PQQ-binding-like beta-propeller repeat protein [Kofleriaceae bacterium]|nr:PQQ-binding-like beta-propeller repeat protein [Kofleriaceae bacterium]
MFLIAGSAHAATIRGRVVDDAKRPVGHAVVAFGASVFAEANAAGEFELRVADDATGIVWVRVPEGFRPEPVWAPWPGSGTIELVVRRLAHPLAQPIELAVASDAHFGIPGNSLLDLADAIDSAIAGNPALFTILGDITQGGIKDQFDTVDHALGELGGLPWIPVPGNHDWYDTGVMWAKRVGPDNYSFDLAGVHFVVWNMALDEDEIVTFLREDLHRVTTSVIALTHAPPSPQILAVLDQLHVRYVLTGHAHSNRVVAHEGVTELNNEPFLMGGLDFTPAGYRVITLTHDTLSSQHHTTVDGPFISVMAPARTQCAPREHAELVVAAELDASTPVVTARLDCGTPITLRWAGGWDWRAELPALAPGAHVVEVTAETPNARATTTATITACDEAPGHDPTQLAPRWVTPVGGHLMSARPAIANGVVFVTVTDLANGNTGGVVALELATGKVMWRAVTPIQVRGGVAVVGDIVVVPRIDGVVLGLDAATGAERWHYTLRPGTAPEAAATFASVTADGTDVMIGHQRELAVLAAHDGHRRWRADPVPEGENSQSLAAVAVGDGLVVGTFNRAFGGVEAWDRATGQPLWKREDSDTVGINATPVIAGHTVFVADAADEVTALDLATGEVKWHAELDPDHGFEWGNATIGTPAYARGILIVPTLYSDVVALDAATGAELWRHAGLPSPLRATHYRGAREAGYEASPMIAGDVVWIADTSGELAALDLRTGAPRSRLAIGAPVLAGLASSGEWLVVASFDGTVRGLAPAAPRPFVATPVCGAATGCSATTPPWWLAIVVIAFVIRSRRC